MNKNQKKLNNKGFSLVELIIVIAIMAVLVGVLAPTYMQYVEKSRKSNDISTIDTVIGAMQVCAVDSSLGLASGDKIVVGLSAAAPTFKATTQAAANEIKKICSTNAILKSDFKGGVDIIGVMGADGTVTVTITGTKAADVKAYSTALATRAPGNATAEGTLLTAE